MSSAERRNSESGRRRGRWSGPPWAFWAGLLLFEALEVSPLFLFVGLAVLMAAEEAYYTRKRRSQVALHRADAEGRLR